MSPRKILVSLCGLLAAVALFAIMGLTFVDVIGRKFLGGSVPGSLELTELLMVVVIFTSLPLVALAGEHVVFDSADRWVPPRLLRLQRAVMESFCAAALAGLAWLMWVKGGQLGEYGETTAQLKMGLAPFVHGMAVLCAVTALVHLLLIVQPVGHHHPGVDEGAP